MTYVASDAASARIGDLSNYVAFSAHGVALDITLRTAFSAEWTSDAVNLRRFVDDLVRLRRTLTGEVSTGDDDSFWLKATANKTGHVTFVFYVRAGGVVRGMKGELEFVFHTDQSYLPELISNLRAVAGEMLEGAR
jgi:hypothetical protein